MFICIPIFFGCQTKVKPDGTEQVPRICPRCHNASIFAAKRTNWFELFFIPVVPFKSKHIWVCGICQFSAEKGPGLWEPSPAGFSIPSDHEWQQGPHQGYQPTYINPNSK